MRLLILGGTQFLGHAIALHAGDVGHDVTCAARGVAGPPPRNTRFIPVNRDEPDGLAPLVGRHFDAVVDVSRQPGQVRRAVAALKPHAGHWTFVSTTSVYADSTTRGQKAATAPLQAPTSSDVECCTEETYGAAKVACEQAVGRQALICRAGLIVGPGDPTGRFSYWIDRLKRGGEVLAPQRPEDPVQVIDVRDLARWIVRAAQMRITGCYDCIGPSYTRLRFLHECAEAIAARCVLTWVDEAFLISHDIRSGSGPRSLPLPMPDTIGDNSRDISPTIGAGLTLRPLSETALDTARWIESADGAVTGLTASEEALALKAWHGVRGGT